jgi:hypothetical protein
MAAGPPPPRWPRLPGLLLLLGLSGCTVTVYQPLTGLQRPRVVDPSVANFEGRRVLVRCHPGEYLNVSSSRQLCRAVATAFRNQGAAVEFEVPRPGRGSAREGEGRPDLVIDLRSRLLHQDESNLQWILSYFTLTLFPTSTEFTFAQDVTIRDPEGVLLVADTLQARFIRSFGAGVWAVNWALDHAVRKEEDKLSGDAAKRDFSRDFYGQLSQLAFNAQMRSWVLNGLEGRPAPSEPES